MNILVEKAPLFPTPNSIGTAKGRSTLGQFGQTLVSCLTSSKSESRAGAESLLQVCVSHGVFTVTALEKVASKLLPAEQRKVRPVLDSLGALQEENVASTNGSETTVSSRQASGRQTPSGRQSLSGRQTPSGRQSLSGRQTPSGRQSVTGRRTPSVSRSSSVRSRSLSRNGRQPLDVDVQDLIRDPSFHPLKCASPITSSKRQRLAKQRDHIPEYPEEPSNSVLQALKKAWSPLLPSESSEVLFPTAGIQKQDDAIDGCALLSRAISLCADEGENNLFIEHLDLVSRWFSIALCSRDATSGLDSLLMLLNNIFNSLQRQNYQLTDSESSILLPYLLEKAGAAKVSWRRIFCHELA